MTTEVQSKLSRSVQKALELADDHIADALVCLYRLRVPEQLQYKIAVLVYKVLHGLTPRYLGPLNYVADLPGRRPLRSATTNRLAVSQVKLTTVANQPDFPDCRPTDLERPAGRSGVCRVVVHLPPASQDSSLHKIIF